MFHLVVEVEAQLRCPPDESAIMHNPHDSHLAPELAAPTAPAATGHHVHMDSSSSSPQMTVAAVAPTPSPAIQRLSLFESEPSSAHASLLSSDPDDEEDDNLDPVAALARQSHSSCASPLLAPTFDAAAVASLRISAEMQVVQHDPSTILIPFTSGNPDIEVIEGVLHVYREYTGSLQQQQQQQQLQQQQQTHQPPGIGVFRDVRPELDTSGNKPVSSPDAVTSAQATVAIAAPLVLQQQQQPQQPQQEQAWIPGPGSLPVREAPVIRGVLARLTHE